MTDTENHREFTVLRTEDDKQLGLYNLINSHKPGEQKTYVEISALEAERAKVVELVNGLRKLAKSVPVNYFEPQYLKDAYELIKKYEAKNERV